MTSLPGKPNREQWTLTFEDMPDQHNRPMCARVRMMLKATLRGFRLRCVDVSSNSPPQPGETSPQQMEDNTLA